LPRRSRGRPIESVALKITFKADKETTAKIRGAIPSAVGRKGGCEVNIEAEHPNDVAEKAKVILEKIRTVV
jgi:hypothetical protein